MASLDYSAVERDVRSVIADYLGLPTERITSGLILGETTDGIYLSGEEMRTLSKRIGKEFGVPTQPWSNTTVSNIARSIGSNLSGLDSEKASKYITD